MTGTDLMGLMGKPDEKFSNEEIVANLHNTISVMYDKLGDAEQMLSEIEDCNDDFDTVDMFTELMKTLLNVSADGIEGGRLSMSGYIVNM